jgi:pimeloyl-ACP methyl ester carboxylesterase
MRAAPVLSWWCILTLAGCAAASPSSSAMSSEYPATVQVNGTALPVVCEGSGGPTIILEAGTDDPLDFIAPLQHRLAEQNLACTYERATSSTPRTAADLNHDLHALLAAAGLPAPYVLVGQSVGGELVQLYARTYPDDVIGVVAMNSGPPCGPWLQALTGLGNVQLLADETANCADNHAVRDRLDLDASWAEEETAPAPPDIPFELVISSADADWCPPNVAVGLRRDHLPWSDCGLADGTLLYPQRAAPPVARRARCADQPDPRRGGPGAPVIPRRHRALAKIDRTCGTPIGV